MSAPFIRTYESRDFGGVDALWNEVFPDNPPHSQAAVSIPDKLAHQPDLLLVAEDGGRIVGTAMAGYDGHRGWLYSIAVAPTHRRSGTGTLLVQEAEARLTALGCRKINLQVRAWNAAVTGFYASLGYVTEEMVSMGKRI